jgi:predicted O-methyltransferase YrrM
MDFFTNRDCGQLWYDDRKWLFETVRELKPAHAVETGTWMGGGSTYFISSALYYNGAGKLITVENDPTMYHTATNLYQTRWPFLLPHVQFVLGDSRTVLPPVLPEVLDFIFLDGNQDHEITRNEFLLLTPRLRVGGILMAHDWFNGKAEAIKPLLESNPQWKLEIMGVHGEGGTFEKGTVGMCRATKLLA